MKKYYLGVTLACLIGNSQIIAQCVNYIDYIAYSNNPKEIYFSATTSTNHPSTVHVLDYGDGSPLDTVSSFPIYTYASGGAYTVTLNSTSPQGTCSVSRTIYVDTCGVSVSHVIDSSGAVHFSSSFVGMPQGSYFEWDFKDNTYSNAQNTSYTYSTPGTYNVRYYYNNSNNNCFASASTSVNVQNVRPQTCDPSFTTSPDQFLLKTLLFHSNSSNFNSHSYTWDFGDGTTGTGRNTNHTYANNGSYLACLTITDTALNCTSSFCDSVYITNTPCKASFVKMKDPGSTYGVILVNNSSKGPSHIYNWDFGDGTQTTGMNPNHQYSSFGTYQVCLTILDTILNCRSTFCDSLGMDSLGNLKSGFGVQVINTSQVGTVGVNELSQTDNDKIALFPNPVKELLTVQFNSFQNSTIYQINDLSGKEIMKSTLTGKKKELDVSNLKKGVYFILFHDGINTDVKKFIKI